MQRSFDRMNLSLRMKLILLCVLPVLVSVSAVGGLALRQFKVFGEQTVLRSYAVLQEQVLELLRIGVERDHNTVQELLRKAADDTRELASSSGMMNYLKASTGENEVLNNLARKEVEGIGGSFVTACRIQQEVTRRKVASDFLVAENLLSSRGGMELESLSLEWEAENRITKEKKKVVLPLCQIGFDPIRPNDSFDEPSPIVDRVQELIAERCTLFQRMNPEGDMLAIAANVRGPDGKRTIGTYVPALDADGKPNPVVSAVLAGETFTGRDRVLNDWYTTAYGPVYEKPDKTGEVIGMLSVGTEEQGSGDLARAITDVKIGRSGHLAVIDSEGTVLIHPQTDLVGKNVIHDLRIEEFREVVSARESGRTKVLSYVSGDRKKFVVYSYFPDWDWIVFGTGYWDEFSGEASQVSKAFLREEIADVYRNATVVVGEGKQQLYHQITFVDDKGQGVLSLKEGRFTSDPESHGNESWFQKTGGLKRDEAYNAGVVMVGEEEKPEVIFASPVFLGNTFKGAVAFHLNWELAWKLLEHRVYGKSGHSYVLDEKGTVVAHPKYDVSDRVNITTGEYGELAVLARDRMLKGEQGTGRYRFEGVDKFVAFMPMKVGRLTYCIAATGPAEEFLALADSIKIESEYKAKRALLFLGIVVLSLALAGSGTGFWVSRQISSPLIQAVHGLSEGNIQIAHVAAEVSSVSGQVAKGASEQARDIDRISSALDEIAFGTRLNAQNTTRAISSRNEAFQALQTADTTMAQSMEAMQDIRFSGEEISRIVQTIKDIAFKTRILALNAAVEAAHAGGPGAGFSVVAGEVRDLSGQVSDAVKIIEKLIEKTVRHIHTGSDLLNKTDQAFRAALDENQRIGSLVEEIADASREQARRVEQIAEALRQLDAVVLCNAANAEESASVSEEMNAQVLQLIEIMGNLLSLVHGCRKEAAVEEKGTVRFHPFT